MSYPDITSACGLPPIGPRALAPLIRQRILTVTLVSRPMNHVCVISLKVGKGKTIQGKTLHLFWLVRLMLQAEEAFFEGMSVLFFSSFFFFSPLCGLPHKTLFPGKSNLCLYLYEIRSSCTKQDQIVYPESTCEG